MQTDFFDRFLEHIENSPLNEKNWGRINTTFDARRAQAHKQQGMEAAATYRKALLERARMVARKLAADGRSITIDDVVEALAIASDAPGMMGNASGSVFCGDGWICTGWTPSRRVSNHGRYIRLWRLK